MHIQQAGQNPNRTLVIKLTDTKNGIEMEERINISAAFRAAPDEVLTHGFEVLYGHWKRTRSWMLEKQRDAAKANGK